jgi:hypothetical protein
MGTAVDGIKENAKSEVLARLVHADLPGTSCVIRMHEMNKLSFFMRRAEGADTPARIGYRPASWRAVIFQRAQRFRGRSLACFRCDAARADVEQIYQ